MKTCVQHISTFTECSHAGPTITHHEPPCPYADDPSVASHWLTITLTVSDKDHDVLEALRSALRSNSNFAWINGYELKDLEGNDFVVIAEKQELAGSCALWQLQQLKARG